MRRFSERGNAGKFHEEALSFAIFEDEDDDDFADERRRIFAGQDCQIWILRSKNAKVAAAAGNKYLSNLSGLKGPFGSGRRHLSPGRPAGLDIDSQT